jgi:hypothetical protein
MSCWMSWIAGTRHLKIPIGRTLGRWYVGVGVGVGVGVRGFDNNGLGENERRLLARLRAMADDAYNKYFGSAANAEAANS